MGDMEGSSLARIEPPKPFVRDPFVVLLVPPAAGCASGSVTVKRLPRPTPDSTEMVPPSTWAGGGEKKDRVMRIRKFGRVVAV
jgi:hypothetical protein